jgi:hypothetical protein
VESPTGRRANDLYRLPLGLLLVCAAIALGCADATDPSALPHPDRLLVPAMEEAAAFVVDVNRREIVRRIGPPLLFQGASVLVDNNTQLITSGRLESGDVVLLGLNPVNGAEVWRSVIARAQVPVLSNGVAVGTFAMVANSRRPELYLWRSDRGGQPGVAVFDYHTRAVTDFWGPFSLRPGGLAFLPPGNRFPEGALIAFGDDAARPVSHASLYFLTGNPLTVQDSMRLPSPSQQALQVQGSADGNDVLVGTEAELLKVDVGTLKITTRAIRPNFGGLVRSPTDGRYFLVAPGATDRPSSDLIHILTPSLELSAVVDLRVLPELDRPLGIGGAVVSRDGRWLYIVSGVRRDGPLYGPQAASILIVNTSSGKVEDIVALRTFGGTSPILMR